MLKRNWSRKIAIKNLAILQTGDLPDILRYRPIFSPYRIGEHTARRKNWPLPRLAANLPVSPKNQSLFLGGKILMTFSATFDNLSEYIEKGVVNFYYVL